MVKLLDILFWSLFIVFPIFSVIQLRVAGERINQVSLVNVTTVALYMFSVVGTLPLFYFLDDYRYYTGVQNQSLVLTVLFYSCVNIIFFLFGVIFVRNFICFKAVSFKSQEIRPLNSLQKIILIGLFGFCALVLLIYLSKVEKVAIIAALTEGANSAKQARSNMGNAFPGKYHWYKLVMHDLGNFLTFACFAIWLNRKKLITLIAFLIPFFYSVFVAIMATEKAPIAWLLIGLFMVYFLVKKDGLVPFRRLIPFAFLLVALLIVSYVYFMGSRDVGSALWSVFSRAFSGSISPAYFYLEFFPVHQDYLLGRTFPNPGGLMPYEPYRYTMEVMNWVFPDLVGSGIVGTAPTVFWGEAYANFGPSGIPVVAFVIGALVSFVSYLASKVEVNPVSIGFLVWLILAFKDLSTTGFSGYFYNIYIIVLSVVTVLILAVRGCIKLRKGSMNASSI